MICEWNASKAATNLRKHGISFQDAATVFLDPLARHSRTRTIPQMNCGEITIGHTIRRLSCSYLTANAGNVSELSVLGSPLGRNVNNLKKQLAKTVDDDLREEYDLSRLKGGVRGKYYQRPTDGTNLVFIEPDLVNVFPDSESVNRALRLLADTARVATSSKRRRR